MKKQEIIIKLKQEISVEKVEIPADRVSTLNCKGITKERKDGNTTRQVNFAIDRLFKGDRIIIRDHYMQGQDRKTNILLLEKILNRLIGETYITLDLIDIDINNLEIEII